MTLLTKPRFYSFGLLLSCFICYLEWGNKSTFLVKAEIDLFTQMEGPAFLHPMILVPLLGQLFLLYSGFQKKPNRKLILAGLILQFILVFMVLLAGSLQLNWKIIISTFPYLIISVLFIRNFKKLKTISDSGN